MLRTSTQVPFHVRRMVAPLLGLPVKRIRVIKPRIGGGFGAQAGDADRGHRRPPRARHPPPGAARAHPGRGVRLVAHPARADDHLPHRGRPGRAAGGAGHAGGGQHRRLRRPRLHRAVRHRTARPVVLQLPGQALLLRRRVHQPAGGRCVPRLRRAAGAASPSSRHMDGHRARRWASTRSSSGGRNWVGVGDPLDIAPRLGERGGTDDIAPEASAAGDQLRHRGVRRPGPAGDRLAPPRRSGLAAPARPAEHPPGHRVRAVHARLRHPVRRHGRLLDQDERRRLVQPAGRRHRPGHRAPTPCSPRSRPRCSGSRVDDILVLRRRHRHHPVRRRAPTRRAPPTSPAWRSKKAAEAGAGTDRGAGRPDARGRGAGDVELRGRRAWAPDGRSVSLGGPGPERACTPRTRNRSWATASYVSARLARRRSRPSSPRSRWTSRPARSPSASSSWPSTAACAINPLTASGQVEGGMIQALGYALTEELVLDDAGRPVNAQLGPYWIFRADDVPATEVFLVADDGAVRSVRRQGGRRDPDRRRRARGPQRHPGRHRRRHQHHRRSPRSECGGRSTTSP